MSYPVRKFDLCVVREDGARKFYDKVGEVVEWPKDDGGTRLQTRLLMFPDLNLATFEQKPREARPEAPEPQAPADEIDTSQIPF